MLIRKLTLCAVFATGLALPAIGSADIVGTGVCDKNAGCVNNLSASEDSGGAWDWLLQALDIVGTGEPAAADGQAAPDIVGTGGE